MKAAADCAVGDCQALSDLRASVAGGHQALDGVDVHHPARPAEVGAA